MLCSALQNTFQAMTFRAWENNKEDSNTIELLALIPLSLQSDSLTLDQRSQGSNSWQWQTCSNKAKHFTDKRTRTFHVTLTIKIIPSPLTLNGSEASLPWLQGLECVVVMSFLLFFFYSNAERMLKESTSKFNSWFDSLLNTSLQPT